MAEGLNKQYRTLRVVPEDKRDVKYGNSRLDGVSVDVAKFKPIAEKIKELQIAQRDDGREDQKKLAEMYADVTAHRVWKIVNQLASQLNQKLDEQADGWQDDAKKLLKDQLKEIEKLVASGAKTIQQAIQGAPAVKEIIKEVQKLIQPLSDKVDKLASESASSGSKTSGSNSGASGTKPGSKPTGKTGSSSPTDIAVPAALAAIAQRISKLQQSIDGKIMSAFGKQNSLSLRVAEMVENIDKNLVGTGTGKAVQRKLNYAQYKVDSKAYSPIVRNATPNKKNGGLLIGFGAGLELGKALPGFLAKAIIGLPVLAVAWLGKKIFGFAGKALAWLFKPLQGALKFLVGTVGMILAPIKFIFGVLSTISGIILGVVNFALKGVFTVLGGIFKLATGIAKGVFKAVAGIFSFVPTAIAWGFKTAFSMLKGIWGGVKSVWNWTKESIKSPGKIYKIAFIAGFVYGFIIKQIKKRGFTEWISNLSGGIWELIQPAIKFLKDLGRNIGKWISEQWTEIIKPAIKRWWNEWEPDTEFGKFVKDGINWVIELFQDGNFFGKDGTMSKCVDSIKKWFEPGGFFGEGGTFRNWWSTLFGDKNKQGVISQWIDRLSSWFDNGDDAKIDQVVQMQKDLAARNGKPMSSTDVENLRKTLKAELSATGLDNFCSKYGIEQKNIFKSIYDWLISAFDSTKGWLRQGIDTVKDWLSSDFMKELLAGKTLSQYLSESKLFKTILYTATGAAGTYAGTRFGSLFGPWGTLIGGVAGALGGYIYAKIKDEEIEDQARIDYLKQGLFGKADILTSGQNAVYQKFTGQDEQFQETLKTRLNDYSKKIQEFVNKAKSSTYTEQQKEMHSYEAARYQELYRLTYMMHLNGMERKEYETQHDNILGDDLAKKNKQLFELYKYSDNPTLHVMRDMTYDHISGMISKGIDLDSINTTDAEEHVRDKLNSWFFGKGRLTKINDVLEKLKSSALYSTYAGEDTVKRERLQQVLTAQMSGNFHKYFSDKNKTDQQIAEMVASDFREFASSEGKDIVHAIMENVKIVGIVDDKAYYKESDYLAAKDAYEKRCAAEEAENERQRRTEFTEAAMLGTKAALSQQQDQQTGSLTPPKASATEAF